MTTPDENRQRVVKFVQEMLIDSGDRASITPALIGEKIDAVVLGPTPKGWFVGFAMSFVVLQALLADAGLTPSDVTIVPYPDYGQGVAVAQGAVDAATGYANNEPLALEASGEQVVVLGAPASTPLPGPGLIVSPKTLTAKHAALEAFVLATLRAMREIAADPQTVYAEIADPDRMGRWSPENVGTGDPARGVLSAGDEFVGHRSQAFHFLLVRHQFLLGERAHSVDDHLLFFAEFELHGGS